jgi:hypothetical protein
MRRLLSARQPAHRAKGIVTMANAAVRSTAYCLNHAPELGLYYGTTPYLERRDNPDSPFIGRLADSFQTYEQAARYSPNQAYIGAITIDQLEAKPRPWHANLTNTPVRFGSYGEIMPEDEFLGLMDICDVFDLVWLEAELAASIREKLRAHPILPAEVLKRMKPGTDLAAILGQVAAHAALPIYLGGRVVGCCRSGHNVDESLSAHVLLENLVSKAGGLLALMHLLHRAGMHADEIDFVIECSEEAAGDMNQRGGGNFAKAIAESAGCVNASGLDIRAFCAAPVDAVITGAALVASGARKNVVVVAGGALAKLFMNAREHVKKGLPALESCLGNLAVLLTPDDGHTPVIRLDALGKHSVGAGASPQAVATALVWDPLQKAGLRFADVDKYAAELHISEITLPAGAGDVAEANAKMTAALAVMKGQLERAAIDDFVARHGVIGFAPTQGHIPSGVPFLGHAVDAIAGGSMQRAMIIGKGSLFLARLTNLSDGASFLVEAASSKPTVALICDQGAKVRVGDAPRDRAEEVRSSESLIRVGLMTAGSELGAAAILDGAALAAVQDPRLRVVAIGRRVSGCDGLEWIETPDREQDIVSAMESAIADGRIDGAVALHYPFPLGVTTVGRVLTPARGRPMLIASCTGMSAGTRMEAMLLNTVYGLAVARALGIERPTVGILSLDGAVSVQRALETLARNGYALDFGTSLRADGGSLLRGNDLLAGTTDVCVCDTLTGNVIMKVLSALNSGGACEVLGWGYGPSVGEDWTRTISIVSRASGAPVIANALCYTAAVLRGRLVDQVSAELAAARAAGLEEVVASLRDSPVQAGDAVAPPSEPTDAEIPGVDVLSIEAAVGELWKAGIYAQSAMGCTGPVIKVPGTSVEVSREVLSRGGYL